jgi:enamine deaminase RidA (YjgF/YER057c/UK114 family)
LKYSDGGGWEVQVGYSRAVRRGTRIEVSGTTSPGSDVYEQCRSALIRALAAVDALGGRREDVVRTRMFVVAGGDWEAAGRAHAELLGDVMPANTTLFVTGLVGDGLLVEVEVEAEVSPE